MADTNREYRDRLFKYIFGNPENKAWTLSLYNAVNGTAYTEAEDIVLTTIEDAVYMNMKNDVSFLVSDTMSFYEQQSTFNPNMPMRFLIYAGMVYSKYIEQTDSYYQYSSTQQKAPTPKCICFYNGKQEREDRTILKLSDTFDGDTDIEVRVTMLNINYGRNKALLDSCQPLKEYSWFVAEVNENQKAQNNIEAAVDTAIDHMPEEFQIRRFLVANRAEVKRMCITEYNEVKTLADERREGRAEGWAEGEAVGWVKGLAEGREEGRAEGREEGRAEGRVEGVLSALVNLVRKGMLSEDKAAAEANMTVNEFREKLATLTV